MGDREYRSIGETLELIKEEFPEVTISKIRFLETQGLIAPERTTNGYRKFYLHDIERLAFVLRQQREQFLPLKVIKDRITEKEPGVFVLDPSKGRFAKSQKSRHSKFENDIFGEPLSEEKNLHESNSNPSHKVEVKASLDTRSESRSPAKKSPTNQIIAAQRGRSTEGEVRSTSYSNRIANDGSAKYSTGLTLGDGLTGTKSSSTSAGHSRITTNRRPRLFALPTSSSLAEKLEEARSLHEGIEDRPDSDELTSGENESNFPKNSYTAREVAEYANLSLVQIEELTTYGLLSPTSLRGQSMYCAADLDLATLAREFARFGLEARHLKMYKVSADREASFLEQVILPILANKTQKSRHRAETALTQLGEFGAQFRTLLLERAIEKILNL